MHYFLNTIKCSPTKHDTHERRLKHKTNYIAVGIRDVRPAKMFFQVKIVAYQELFNNVTLLPISTHPQKRQKRENKQNKSLELAAHFFFAFIERLTLSKEIEMAMRQLHLSLRSTRLRKSLKCPCRGLDVFFFFNAKRHNFLTHRPHPQAQHTSLDRT